MPASRTAAQRVRVHDSAAVDPFVRALHSSPGHLCSTPTHKPRTLLGCSDAWCDEDSMDYLMMAMPGCSADQPARDCRQAKLMHGNDCTTASPGPPAAAARLSDEQRACISARVEEFLMSLPLGTDRAAARVEAAVGAALASAHVSNAQLRGRLGSWMRLAQELQVLVAQQQRELQQAGPTTHGVQQVAGAVTAAAAVAAAPSACSQGQQVHMQQGEQLGAADNAELRMQLQSADARVRELEGMLARLGAQQVSCTRPKDSLASNYSQASSSLPASAVLVWPATMHLLL